MKAQSHILLLLSIAVLSNAPRTVWAQAVAGGQIHGAVSDATGAAITDATVDATQTDSGLHRVAKSGSDGSYVLPNLPVGHIRCA